MTYAEKRDAAAWVRMEKYQKLFQEKPDLATIDPIFGAFCYGSDWCRDTYGWKPIETAPKDGTAVICLTEDCVHYLVESMRWCKNVEAWYSETTGNHKRPTHWMLIPKPPKEEG